MKKLSAFCLSPPPVYQTPDAIISLPAQITPKSCHESPEKPFLYESDTAEIGAIVTNKVTETEQATEIGALETQRAVEIEQATESEIRLEDAKSPNDGSLLIN